MGWKRGLGAKRGSCGVEKEGKEASVGRRKVGVERRVAGNLGGKV